MDVSTEEAERSDEEQEQVPQQDSNGVDGSKTAIGTESKGNDGHHFQRAIASWRGMLIFVPLIESR
jgi:hypothetical protein